MMIADREIVKIANEAYNEFLTNFLVDCQFESVSLNKIYSMAEKNSNIQDIMKEKSYKSVKELSILVLITPGEKYKISFCGAIVNKILRGFSKEKQKLFIQAITIHELYHIVNLVQKRELNNYNFIRSEKRALSEFKEDYPLLAKILEEAKKRTKNK